MKKELTWQNVLHANHLLPQGHIENFYNRVVAMTGYPYFIWNDKVFQVVDKYNNPPYSDTGLTVDDID